MQGPDTMHAANAKAQVPPAVPRREENSGLHEIRELATTAKMRIRRRRTSDHDVQEQLFAPASGLHAVALPEPGKEQPPALAADTTETAAVSSTTAAADSEPQKRRLPVLAIGAVSALALCAAAAAFVYLGGFQLLEGEVAAGGAAAETDSMKAESPASAAASGAAEAAPETEPQVASLGGAGGAGGEAAVAGELGGIAPETEGEEAEAARAASASGEREAEPPRDRSRAERKDAESKGKATEAKVAEKSASKTEEPDPAEAAGAEAYSASSDDTGDGSIDDILSDVTGGVKEDSAGAREEKPAKKSLDRSDVARAMRPISGRAGKCHDKEGETGTVSVRFTVEPSGELTGVSATGKYEGTATGKCVEAAVKSARFPAFSGRPMTFTFPFLLAQ